MLTKTIRALTLFAGLTIVSAAQAGVVAYWRFENGTADTAAVGSGTILDYSGSGLNGTPIGGPLYRANVAINPIPQTGQSNTLSMDFNGTNQRVSIPDNALFQLTHSLTLEADIYVRSTPPPGAPPAQILFRGDDRVGLDPYFLALTGDNVAFSVQNASNQSAAAIAPLPGLDKWIHVAGTLDDATGNMRLYINGNLAKSLVTSVRPMATLDAAANPGLGIGNLQSATYSEYFNGLIDEVRISDQALSPSQLLSAPTIPGDADRDGVVGFDDLVTVARNYGRQSGAVWETGDFNGDGSVGFDDLVIVARHYGQGAAAAAQPQLATVPEPDGIGALIAAAALLPSRKRRRHGEKCCGYWPGSPDSFETSRTRDIIL